MSAALINHLWQSTLFCAGVWLITLTLRANGAALRHCLWLTASLKFLVPFAALAAVGNLVQWEHAPAPIRSVAASPTARDFNAPFAEMALDQTALVTVTAQSEWIAR